VRRRSFNSIAAARICLNALFQQKTLKISARPYGLRVILAGNMGWVSVAAMKLFAARN